MKIPLDETLEEGYFQQMTYFPLSKKLKRTF